MRLTDAWSVGRKYERTSEQMGAKKLARGPSEVRLRMTLEPVASSGGAKVLFARPFRLDDEAIMPCVLKISTAELIRDELKEMEKASEIFGMYISRVLDYSSGLHSWACHKPQQKAVMQLEITGSRNSLPRFTDAPLDATPCSILYERATDLGNEEERLRNEIAVFDATHLLFRDIMPRCTLKNSCVERVDVAWPVVRNSSRLF